jgi:phosphatidylethanolamine/phosphatidyl-N-methylethanolamine N-methyltransferase
MKPFTLEPSRAPQRGWPRGCRPASAPVLSREERRSERQQFLGSFLRSPLRMGALAPSSPMLAKAMLADCDLRNAQVVVELGPGTGSFTRLILERIGQGAVFFAMELDESSVRRLRVAFPDIEVHHRSAEHLPNLMETRGRRVDCVVSGLPWANMGAEVQDRILDGVVRSLSPHGVFTTFAYLHARWLPGAVRFRRRLDQRFTSVRTSPVVWRNLPPAYVYCCRHPIGLGLRG